MNSVRVPCKALLATGSQAPAEAATGAVPISISTAVKVPDKLLSVLFPVSIVQ